MSKMMRAFLFSIVFIFCAATIPAQESRVTPRVVSVPSQIGDRVWNDANGNGVQDAGEEGLGGWIVTISGTSLPTGYTPTRTTDTNGTYTFNNLPAGAYTICVTAQGGWSETYDLDGVATANCATRTTAAGENATDVDFGYRQLGSIGDRVWLDQNRNGAQDGGEPGINGVTVTLSGTDAWGNLVSRSTVTASSGNFDGYYQFTGLPAGTYIVTVDLTSPPLVGLTPSPTGVGAAATDSNANPSTVALAAGGSDQTIDFGFYTPCSGQIGNFVWNDYNRNGIQDAGEPGIPGISVKLMNASSTILLNTTQTGPNGNYLFSGVCAGTYSVMVDETTLPAGYTPTIVTAPGSTPSNDNNGAPASVTLPQDNSVDSSIDFGYLQPCTGQIGDFVWHDLNRNGVQDTNEPGIDGVLVLLKSGGATVNSATTASGGKYQLSGVCAGNYSVEVANLPPDFAPTKSNAPGSAPSNDSNGSPAAVTLATPDAVDWTIDFGFVGSCAGVIGDFIWNDLNHNGIQDVGEPGWQGVTVLLHKSVDNSIVGTAYTDASGNYSFTGQCTGSYSVEVVPPAGYASSPTGQGALDKDSNPNSSAVTLATDRASDLTIDFGFYGGSIGDRVWNDANGNGIQDAGEDGLGGWIVTISGTSLPTGYTPTRTTDTNGAYTFDNLPAGIYTVCVTAQGGWTETYDLDGVATINCATRTTTAGENATNVDFGYRQLGSVAGTVYTDSNKNSVLDSGEPRISGVTITLTDCSGNTLSTAMTAAGGTYLFSNLAAGCYKVSSQAAANGETLETPSPLTVNLSAGQNSTDNNFGYIYPPISATCANITAIQNVPITPVTLTASGGTGTGYKFSASGLPAGLSISEAGTISGKPTVSGSFNYIVTVTDSAGNTGTANCLVTVAPAVSANCVSITAVQGAAITPVTMTGDGGAGGPYTFLATGLPAGLTMSTTGTISGTPTVSGTFNYSVTAADKDGNKGTVNCSVAVTTPPLNVCGLTWGYWKNHVSVWPVTSLVMGLQTYSQTELLNLLGMPVAGDASINLAHQLIAAKLNVANGTDPATDNGSIAAADAVLSPFSGKLPYNVSSSSAVGSQMTTVAGALDDFNSDGAAQPGCANGFASITLTCPSGPGQVGVAYSSALKVTGGMAPYTFTIIGGTLPPGLTLNPTTGAITGTPTTAGTFSFTALVADATSVPGSRVGTSTVSCSITIAPPPQPITVACPTNSGTVGVGYSSSVVATGGVNPYTDAISSGSLPAGLNLNSSTGAITGAPTAQGLYSFTVTATDSKGASGTGNCSISVAGAITSGQFTTYTQGGWGAPAKGNNPGALLLANFSKVYGGAVAIGGGFKLTFTNALAITNFLPQGGTPGKLTANATDVSKSAAGVLAGQVLALQLSVDFSDKGITPTGLAKLTVVSGPWEGLTVAQVLAKANDILGGGVLPPGMSYSDVTSVIDAINNNFDSGKVNKGYLH